MKGQHARILCLGATLVYKPLPLRPQPPRARWCLGATLGYQAALAQLAVPWLKGATLPAGKRLPQLPLTWSARPQVGDQ